MTVEIWMGLVAVLGFAVVSGGWLPVVLLLALAIALHGRIAARYSATPDQQRGRFLLLSLPVVAIVFFQLLSTRLNFQTPQFIAVSGTVYILACGVLEMYRVNSQVRPANYHLSLITAIFVAGISAGNQSYPFFLLAYFALAARLLRHPYGGWWRREGVAQPPAPWWGVLLGFALSLVVAWPTRYILPGLGRALTQMYTQSLLNGSLPGGTLFGNISDLNGTLRNARSRLLVLRVSGPPGLLKAQVYDTYQDGRWQAPTVTRQNRLEIKADQQGLITLPGPEPRLSHWSIAPVLDISGPLPVCPDPYRLAGLATLNLDLLDSITADAFEPYQVWGGTEAQRRSPRGPSPQSPAYLNVPEELREPLRAWSEPIVGKGEPLSLLTNVLLQRGVYDAEARRAPGLDPVLGFLENDLHGHCELFASTLALSLRLRGLPTRYVVGFQMNEFNALAKHYLVRERDAHAWVEVYFNGNWVTCDPTPASQTLAAHPDGFQLEFGDQVVDWVRGIWAALLSWLRRTHLPAWPLLTASASLVLWLAWRFRGLFQAGGPRRQDGLGQLLAKFESRARQQRQDHETVLEFSQRLPAPYAEWLIDYARARFGGQDLKAELTRRLELLPAIDKIQPPFRAEP